MLMFEGITVLMPVYNGEAYLKEAIDSVLNQTFKDFEFLIIDDGSSDQSVDIVNSYKDSRIRLIQNEKNLGITQTLNAGIELAKYELIARMDADDVCLPKRLQKQYEYFLAHPKIGLLATWANEFYEDHKEIVYQLNPDYYYYNLVCECWIYHPTVMFRKSAVIEAGKYQYKYCEDYDLWWRLTRKYDLAIIPEALLHYRYTKESISRVSKKTEYELAHREQLIRNVNFYTGKNLELTEDEIDFLMINLEPIVENKNIKHFKSFFRKLELIDKYILEKEKQRFPIAILHKAAFDKRDRIAYKLLSYYSLKKVVKLLFELKYWQLAIKYINYGLSIKIKKR